MLYRLSIAIFQFIADIVFSEEVLALATIIAAIIAIYKFVYLRPELFVDVDIVSYHERTSHTVAIMRLYLVNGGNRFAEDVQISFTLDAFKFENDIPATDYVTEDYRIPETELDIRSGMKGGYIGGGRRHDIYVENPVYEKDVMKMYFGETIFDSEGTHELKYSVACRTHGLRKGKITFEVRHNKITVTKNYPTLLRNLKARLGWKPEIKRVEQVENLSDDDVEVSYRVGD